MPMIGHFHTHYKTLKNQEVTWLEARISSCFAISVETALVVGLERHQGMLHPSGFVADVPLTNHQFGNDSNSGNWNAVMAADLADTHLAADSAPGSCNMCLEEQKLFGNQAHEPTSLNYHSEYQWKKGKG